MIVPTFHDDIIDSRDVIEALSMLAEGKLDMEDFSTSTDPTGKHNIDFLRSLLDQGPDYAEDWEYGATLIRDTYFVDYAQEFAEDIGAIDRNAAWPACHIDWEAAADDLRQDYSAIEAPYPYGTVTYWVR